MEIESEVIDGKYKLSGEWTAVIDQPAPNEFVARFLGEVAKIDAKYVKDCLIGTRADWRAFRENAAHEWQFVKDMVGCLLVLPLGICGILIEVAAGWYRSCRLPK